MVRVLAFLSLCLFAVAGCGSSHSPQDDCNFYVENELCPTLMYCGATYSSLGSCINFFENSGNTVLDCATVTAEYAGLSTCEADTNYSSCGYVVDALGYATLPASCYGVFN
jgi:hypothetical protein